MNVRDLSNYVATCSHSDANLYDASEASHLVVAGTATDLHFLGEHTIVNARDLRFGKALDFDVRRR